MSSKPATQETKTAIDNAVTWVMADQMHDHSVSIATKKYLTHDNLLLYITLCTMGQAAVPRVKVQVYERVAGGVRESGYQLFADQRLEKYDNDMIFGNTTKTNSDASVRTVVSEKEAQDLLARIASLATTARQTL